MKPPKQKSIAELQKEVDDFNAKYKVGDSVAVILDSGKTVAATVYHKATILGGHTAVGWFDHPEISGCYNLKNVVR